MGVHESSLSEMSYELYQEIAHELLLPLEESLAPDVRLALYESKLVYLENLRSHCFREMNSRREGSGFTQADLERIQNAQVATGDFIRDLLRASVLASLERRELRAELRGAENADNEARNGAVFPAEGTKENA